MRKLIDENSSAEELQSNFSIKDATFQLHLLGMQLGL
jgi:hypothetical protein